MGFAREPTETAETRTGFDIRVTEIEYESRRRPECLYEYEDENEYDDERYAVGTNYPSSEK